MATPEKLVGECAKICYSTKAIEDGGKDITYAMVNDYKHLASLRFAYATFTISEISRACANQLVRSSHMDFMQESMRYVSNKKGNFEFIMPEGLSDGHKLSMENHWRSTIALYNGMVREGVKKEDARAILPLNTSTKINCTANLQGWMSLFNLRLKPGAQAEIRKLARNIYIELAAEYPQVFTPELFTKLQEK